MSLAATLKRLDDLAQRKPEMAETVAFYRAVVPILHQAQQEVPPFTLEPAIARHKLETGQPLLVGEALPLDEAKTTALFLRLCQVVEKSGTPAQNQRTGWSLFRRGRPDPVQVMAEAMAGNEAVIRATATRQIRQAVEQKQLDLADIWEAVAEGDEMRWGNAAADLHLDANLLYVLAQNSLKPALQAWSRSLQTAVHQAEWRQGYCPMCGNPPTLAEIRGKEGERRLRCTVCGASWTYPRLQCAFCQNHDHKLLGYLAVEGEEGKYRLQTCDACHNYLKVVITYDPIPVDQLFIEDLATLHLDFVAHERDFAHM